MGFLNLMRNKLKPKEVNDILENIIPLPDVTSSDNGKTLQVVEGVWATGSKIPKVVNVLNSTSTTDALSAAKGKELKETIDGKVDTWTYLGEKTGTAEQNLHEGWKELLMQVNVTSANLVTYHIYNSQTEEYTNTALGAYGTSYAVGQISRTKAKISTVNWAGSDVTSTAKLYTYYR